MLTKIENYFNDDLIGNYHKGKSARQTFTDIVDEFFDDWDSNVYIAGQAGVGKTFLVKEMATKYPDVHFIQISGQMSAWHFTQRLAVEMYFAEMHGKTKIAFYLDDINTLFKHVELMDMFKIMLDPKAGAAKFEYNKGIQIGSLDEIEAEAIQYWKDKNPTRTGFEIDFKDRVKFIMTMNTPLPTPTDIAKMKEGDKKIKQTNLSAVTSRFGDGYQDLMMTKDQMWGWMAYVVWNDPTMCEGATFEQRYEMLQYLWDGWEKCNEHSLRMVEFTMWKIMKKKPLRKDYTSRWSRHFTNIQGGK
tara:strand:- start:1307 stop:2212 length:906 start_codon:yes stop_codon:yes gene_type:complete